MIEPAPAEFDQAPADLEGDDIAVDEWTRVVPTLRRIGLVSVLERSALIALCQQWSRYVAAQDEIRSAGLVIATENGPIANPSLGVADRALEKCLKLWQELGLTPAGRSKMASLVPKPEPLAAGKWAGML
jgi:P27 family predicted phage terminase small subunit